MTDWADAKAREWWNGPSRYSPSDPIASLAALLREVDGRARSETLVKCCIHDTVAPEPDCECVICHRQRVLAEVRRVVDLTRRWAYRSSINPTYKMASREVCDEILARLDAPNLDCTCKGDHECEAHRC